MKASLYCPSCSRPIADVHNHSSPVTCAACHKRYGIVYGKLSRRTSLFETLFFFSPRLPSFYKRHYTLHITTPDRTLQQFQFSLPGKLDELPVRYGDIISVLYTMQGYMMKKLVAITNHTTGKRHILSAPIPSRWYQALLLSLGVMGVLALAYLNGISLLWVGAVNLLGILLYLRVTNMTKLSSVPLGTPGSESGRLLTDQKLLIQRQGIERRVEELNHESSSGHALIEQLERLKQKMLDVDQELYSARIYRSTTAIRILKQQIVNNHRLVREYRRAQRMIDIEVETSWVADQLPDAENFAQAIAQKLTELKEIEDQNQFLKLQLAAYEEVNYPRLPSY